MSATINPEERRKFAAKLKQMSLKAKNRVKSVTAATAEEIVTNAKINLQTTTSNPNIDLTTIRQSINKQQLSEYSYEIRVNALPMGAYIEFGTGAYVQVAPEWQEMAWEFYVNGKGTMKPKPYLYPAYRQGIEQYKKDLKAALK